jgi:ankyrin repeat protein
MEGTDKMHKRERRRSSFLLFPVQAAETTRSATPATKSPTDALFFAIRNRNFFLAKRLVEDGADVESVKNGRTPLALMVEMGCGSAVKMFLQLGADVSGGPNGSDPPLLVAAKAADLNMVALLLELGADPDGKGVS